MNVEQMADLLTTMVDGRPVKVEMAGDELIAMVMNDDQSKNVQFTVTEAELCDPEFKERMLTPVLNSLDSATFPERHRRYMDATKRIARSFAQD